MKTGLWAIDFFSKFCSNKAVTHSGFKGRTKVQKAVGPGVAVIVIVVILALLAGVWYMVYGRPHQRQARMAEAATAVATEKQPATGMPLGGWGIKTSDGLVEVRLLLDQPTIPARTPAKWLAKIVFGYRGQKAEVNAEHSAFGASGLSSGYYIFYNWKVWQDNTDSPITGSFVSPIGQCFSLPSGLEVKITKVTEIVPERLPPLKK